MKVHTLSRTQRIPLPPEQVFSFFGDPGNLARITPSWLGFRILTPLPVEMKVGTLIDYSITWVILPILWRTLITTYRPPFSFVDEQLKGPYAYWHHAHEFRAVDGGTEMTDTVHYLLPGGILGHIAHTLVVRDQLAAIFDFRAKMIGEFFSSDMKKNMIPFQEPPR